MARGLREHGFLKASWFMKNGTRHFLMFFMLAGPIPISIAYMAKNWELKKYNQAWYNSLNTKEDPEYQTRLFAGLEDPAAFRGRLNKLLPPSEYKSHLPADDFVAHNGQWRNNGIF